MRRLTEGWREVGWGSDAALVFWAPTQEGLLVQGAKALLGFSLRSVPEQAPGPGPLVWVESLDTTELVLDWLNEINYRLTVHAWASWEPAILRLTETGVHARLDGFPVPRERQWFRHEVKAVTRHDPLVRATKAGWVARVILDL